MPVGKLRVRVLYGLLVAAALGVVHPPSGSDLP
jgi:hypothetical protein